MYAFVLNVRSVIFLRSIFFPEMILIMMERDRVFYDIISKSVAATAVSGGGSDIRILDISYV